MIWTSLFSILLTYLFFLSILLISCLILYANFMYFISTDGKESNNNNN